MAPPGAEATRSGDPARFRPAPVPPFAIVAVTRQPTRTDLMTSKIIPIAVALTVGGAAAPVQAAPPKPVKYANCAALNAVYKHGVAKDGAADRVSSGKPVTTFLVYPAAYLRNTHLDRDKDGVACEKK